MYPPFMILFLPGLAMVGFGIAVKWSYAKLIRTCNTPVEGVFVRYSSIPVHSKSAAMGYWPIFSYSVNGTEYTLRGHGIPTPLYSEGDKVEMLYDPGDPEKCYLVGDKSSKNRSGWILIVFGAVFIIASVAYDYPPL